MFENVIMLAGLGGAVVPLVIHLLGRARYQTLDWGAMMFLDPTTPPWRDGARLREYALLAVRMAAVGLLAVALARPVARSVGEMTAVAITPATAAAQDRAAVGIILDCSASMDYHGVGRSRMEAARSAALQVISTLKRGDRVALIAAGAPEGQAVTPLTGDLQAVAARIADLKPVAGVARLDEALDAAIDALSRAEEAVRQLYLVTDQQASSWRGLDEAYLASWRARKLTETLDRFAVLPVGGREIDNVAVESITLLNPPAVRGLPARVAVTVRNFGRESRAGLPLTLRVTGGDSTATTVNVAAMETTTATLSLTFARAGSAVLTAEVRDAAGRAAGPGLDDQRGHVIEVVPSIRTLIVRAGSAPATAPGTSGAVDPLIAALSPFGSTGQKGPDLATVEGIGVRRWEPADLGARYDVVVLDDVPAITEAQASELERFVYAGGGLLLAPGPSTRIDDYNRLLYNDENGLMPGVLQPAVTPPEPLAIEASTIEFASPMMGFFTRDAASAALAGGGAFSEARAERFFPLTGRTAAAHAIAAFGTGDAFLVEHPFGRGRVALVTCSLRSAWSTLPLTSLYLPLVQSTVRHLASGRAANLNFAIGDEVVTTIAIESDAPAPRGGVIVFRPDDTRDTFDLPPPIDGQSEIRYARTNVPGRYTLRVGPRGGADAAKRTTTFWVAADPAESDLTPLPPARWDALQAALGFTRMDVDGRALASRLDAGRGGAGGEYWMLLLAGVLGLFVLELALTRYWAGRL